MIFDNLRGQERAVRRLTAFLAARRIPSALLFSGPDGTGKSLAAREFAKALACRAPAHSLMERGTGPSGPCAACADCLGVDRGLHPDVKAVNAAYQAGLRQEEPAKQETLRVETIRHLRRDMELQSMLGQWKTAVIEEAHTLEIEAANALLKIIEEPPPKTLWILVTSQKERLPRTILSRCFTVAFAPLSEKIVKEILIERNIEPPKAENLAKLAEGSVSRAMDMADAPDYAAEFARSPAAAIASAERLPRELYLARARVELALYSLAQDLRLKHLQAGLPFENVEGPLRRLLGLRAALRSNADPKLILALAGLEASGEPA